MRRRGDPGPSPGDCAAAGELRARRGARPALTFGERSADHLLDGPWLSGVDVTSGPPREVNGSHKCPARV